MVVTTVEQWSGVSIIEVDSRGVHGPLFCVIACRLQPFRTVTVARAVPSSPVVMSTASGVLVLPAGGVMRSRTGSPATGPCSVSTATVILRDTPHGSAPLDILTRLSGTVADSVRLWLLLMFVPLAVRALTLSTLEWMVVGHSTIPSNVPDPRLVVVDILQELTLRFNVFRSESAPEI